MKIIIINPFGIGDVLFTTPVIRAIKDRHPNSFIGYWCNERVGELLCGEPSIDKIFPLSRGDIKRIYRESKGINRVLKGFIALLSLIRKIRKEKFDIAFDFSLDSRYGLWSKLARIKKRIGLDYKGRGRFLTDKIALKAYAGKHVIEHDLDLLKFINIEPRCKSPDLVASEKDKAKARGILKEYGVATTDILIGVAPGGGASWGKDAIYKQWSAEKFAEVVSALGKNNVTVVLLGSVEDKEIAEIVRGRGQTQSAHNRRVGSDPIPLGSDPIPPIIDLTGKLNLKELAAIISELKLLICNDGGPLHMAVALGVKTVSIFGPVDEKVYGPYPSSAKHIIIKRDLSCRPCYKDFRFTGCSNNRKCLEDITVDEVFVQVKGLLRPSGPHNDEL